MHTPRSAIPWLAPIAAIALAACAQRGVGPSPDVSIPSISESVSPLPADVVDVTWQWVGFTTPVEQVTIDAPDRYTIRFDTAGRVALRADCNRGTSSYAATADRRLTVQPAALTRAVCGAGSLGDRFAREVSRVLGYFLKDGDLYLDLPKDSGTLRFRRQP